MRSSSVPAAVAGAAGLAVAAVDSGAAQLELVDAANSGFLRSCSFPFSKSCRSPSATWYSSCSHYPCPTVSCSNSEVAGPEPASGNTPVEQCSYGENYRFGSWK